MVDKLLDLLTFSSDSLDTIDINVFKKLVNLLVIVNLVNKRSQKLNEGFIVVLNTEEKAVE